MSGYRAPGEAIQGPPPDRTGAFVGVFALGVLLGAVVVGVVVGGGPSWDEDRVVAATPPMRAVDLGPSPTPQPVIFVMATEPPTTTPSPRPKAKATSTPYPICQTAIPGDLCVVPMPPQPTPTPMPACGPAVEAGSLCMWREPTP